jgi:hypothetical protein
MTPNGQAAHPLDKAAIREPHSITCSKGKLLASRAATTEDKRRGEIRTCLLEKLIGLAQFPNLTLQFLDPGLIFTRWGSAVPRIPGSPDTPSAQRVVCNRRSNTRPCRGVLDDCIAGQSMQKIVDALADRASF